ncbi:hypothetical protein FB570_119112 [Streptomyces sp. T12]|uniref:hypothetical protein n=1 Tax=Streptomyces sp. T12 TaxID=477697 RepID=UPI0011A067B2|nr:hypothetical protein [Streptomyces sp. T12]TWD13185.1 hypothetical protein FB570_119112 [Streptomyces sp. T12]
MRVIEGTPREIVEYEHLAGAGAETTSTEDNPTSPDHGTEPARETAAPDGSASLSPEDHVALMKFIYGRAGKNDVRTFLTERFVMRLLDEEDVVVAFGRSSKTFDGLADYLMIRDDGPQRYGAVAYLRPSNGGMTVRLTPDDIERLGEKNNPYIQYRNVALTDPYKINCPLADEDALNLAHELVRAALDIVRNE